MCGNGLDWSETKGVKPNVLKMYIISLNYSQTRRSHFLPQRTKGVLQPGGHYGVKYILSAFKQEVVYFSFLVLSYTPIYLNIYYVTVYLW